MTLSILIATTIERRPLFEILYAELLKQAAGLNVEVLYEEDNKEISVGAKRQKLLLKAQGKYIVFFDSDDWPMPDYVLEIMTALEQEPDCVGFLIHMTTNGKNPQVCCHSLRFKKWEKNRHGYHYVRSPGHFNPIRRKLALLVGFRDMRFGEDHEYSRRITPMLRREVFINKALFHYRYTNTMNHSQKYGIK